LLEKTVLTETGKVVAIDDDAVWVETLRQSTCGSCTARAGCGHGMVNSALEAKSRGVVRALLPAGGGEPLSLHDTVLISLPEQTFLRSAALLYALPLLAMLAAALVADHLYGDAGLSAAGADLRVVLGAVLGLSAGLLALRVLSRRSAANPMLNPRVTTRV
jgi:sigma-E factor negative regulatory protein RseC